MIVARSLESQSRFGCPLGAKSGHMDLYDFLEAVAIVALQLNEPLLPGRFEPREQRPRRRSFIEVFSLRRSHRAATSPGSSLKLLQDWSSAVDLSARRNCAPAASRLALGVRNFKTHDGRTAHDVVMY